jgi:uncharacterized protein YggE
VKRRFSVIAVALLLVLPTAAQVQPPIAPAATSGTLIVMTGTAEVDVANDEALANFFYETQAPDLTKAQADVNQRVADGTAALKRADSKAQIETSGYSSFPVYSGGSSRTIVGWRVRQGVSLRTENLAALPKTVAAAQPMLALGNIDFRLSRAAREKVEAQLIQQATANLHSRFAAAAQALGGASARVRIEEINYGAREGGPQPLAMRSVPMASEASVPPPTFEAGRSVERLTVSGKARLLP